jgi:hypothetical protein
MNEYNIGDSIRLTSAGSVRSSASDFAEKLGAINFQDRRGQCSGHLSDGMLGTIVNKRSLNVFVGEEMMYLLRMTDGYDYVFSDGFEVIRKKEVKQYGIVKFMESIAK